MNSERNVSIELAGVLILAGGLSTRMGMPKALLTLPSGETLLDYHVRQAAGFGAPILIADNGQGFEVATEVSYHIKSQNMVLSHVLDYAPSNAESKRVKNNKLKHSAGPLGAILAGLQYCMPRKMAVNERSTVYTNADSDTDIDIGKEAREEKARKSDKAEWLLVVSCDSLVSASDIWHCLKSQVRHEKSLNNDKLNNAKLDDDKEDQSQIRQPEKLKIHEQHSHKQRQPQVYALDDGNRLYPLLGLYHLATTSELQSYLDNGERRVMGFIKPICQSVTMPEQWHNLSNLNTPQDFNIACQSL